MRTTTLIISILVLGATAVCAETFNPAQYLAEPEVDVLTRNVANEQFGRDLFGDPYATVVVGNVDVYDRFPYLEARYFQIVSDPSWNRLLMGEMGRGLASYDGAESGFGRLTGPRGLSSDGLGHVFVADTGNDRVLVFRTISEFDRIELEPMYAIEGLAKPFDVAYSDGGTPFDARDDRLYVANTGRNEVKLYEIANNRPKLIHTIGELGSGTERFAGPMAITVGRRDGAHGSDIYVSDAHNQRLVHLRDTGSALVWAGEATHSMGIVTSLDTDHWGNVYAAAPQVGRINKFTSSLLSIASYEAGVTRPRSFHVPFANVTDHRTGEQTRAGQGSGIVVEQWSRDSGIRMLNLGVDITAALVLKEEGAAVRLTLTDHATVTATITDPRSGDVIARHDAGVMDAGMQVLRFADDDFVAAWEADAYHLTIEATSTYKGGEVTTMEMPIEMNSAGAPALPDRLTTLGNAPNPFNPSTMIRFVVPAGPNRAYSLRVYDVRGQLVRQLASGQLAGGLQEVRWDGRNDNGGPVSSGIYLYRVDVGKERFTGKMVLVK